MVKHNLFVDLKLIMRSFVPEVTAVTSPSLTALDESKSTIGSLSLRWNVAPRNYDF
jgi:hypothetical protein